MISAIAGDAGGREVGVHGGAGIEQVARLLLHRPIARVGEYTVRAGKWGGETDEGDEQFARVEERVPFNVFIVINLFTLTYLIMIQSAISVSNNKFKKSALLISLDDEDRWM